ncbi:MAG: polyphosphate polymerase domain-containing protein [Bacteroidota bacterium]
MNTELHSLLNEFEAIGLEQMDRVSLMDRIDSKYVFHASKLSELLSELKKDYAVLHVNDKMISQYESLYFDTPKFDLYHFHQRGKFNRFKFRIRKYVESNISFFEVKFKNNKGRTKKSRVLNDNFELKDNQVINDFLHQNSKYDIEQLEEKVWINYSRITLVNKEIAERVTIDVNLHFIFDNIDKTLKEFVVAEVKQNKSSHSPFVNLMHKHHIREGSISKYCLGIMNIYPDLRSNNFKPFQINLKKIIKNNDDLQTT